MLTPHVIAEINTFLLSDPLCKAEIEYDRDGVVTRVTSHDVDGPVQAVVPGMVLFTQLIAAAQTLVDFTDRDPAGGTVFYVPEQEGAHDGE